jgi:hypothetical protein
MDIVAVSNLGGTPTLPSVSASVTSAETDAVTVPVVLPAEAVPEFLVLVCALDATETTLFRELAV